VTGLRLSRAIIVLAIVAGACTAGAETEPGSPSAGEGRQGPVSEDAGSAGSVPGRFQYRFNSITAAATFDGRVATLRVRNGTGSELGAPALYVMGTDDRRYEGVASGAEPIPDGAQVIVEFTFPDAVEPDTIGLAVLVLGDENVGAMAPVLRAG
jgi:hypothetical protein